MTTQRPTFTPLMASLPSTVPFVGPETQERASGRRFKARIGANESAFGPAPSVIAAIRGAADETWKYGDPENYELKMALATHYGVGANNTVVGEGIDGLLGLACRLFLNEGDVVVTSLGAYPTFNFHVAASGGRLVTAPYRDDKEDLDALLGAAKREKAKIVYLANPDNPMGSWHEAPEIEAFITALPPETLFVFDEAYSETAPPSSIPRLDLNRTNVLRFRTFSKAYGLAGSRVGYALGAPEVVGAFDKIRNHFGVNRLGQVAALAALADQAYLADVVANIAAARDRIAQIARDNGLTPLPSATNFVAIDCARDGAYAKQVLDGLIARDIFVRKPMAPVLDRCIRVSVGQPADLDAFAEALAKALKEHG